MSHFVIITEWTETQGLRPRTLEPGSKIQKLRPITHDPSPETQDPEPRTNNSESENPDPGPEKCDQGLGYTLHTV